MVPALTSHLGLTSCGIKPNSPLAYGTDRAVTPPGNQGNTESSVHTTKLNFSWQKLCPDSCWRLDVWLKWSSNKNRLCSAPHTKDIQRTATSQFSSEGTRGGQVSRYLKTPKRLHTLYTNKSAWKTEGLAQSVLNMVVTTVWTEMHDRTAY